MKDTPLLMCGEMVRPTLADLKTQTRRAFSARMIELMKLAARAGEVSPFIENGSLERNDASYIKGFCPYGQPGDRLWVRETWRIVGRMATEYMVQYKADESTQTIDVGWEGPSPALDAQIHQEKFHPSIHMPRWASRITLEIVSVRVERVQSITEADAVAEGVIPQGRRMNYRWDMNGEDHAYRLQYSDLWNQINQKRGFGWVLNPWVWVVEFKRVEAAKAGKGKGQSLVTSSPTE